MNVKALAGDERLFIESLIQRSGWINRKIMLLYLSIDTRGLDRWQAYIARTRGKKRKLNLVSYWPLRILERITAIYVGGSLTGAEQQTFGKIAGIPDYKLSRYNAAIFGTWAGITFFSGGEITNWLSSVASPLDKPLGFTTYFLYAMGVVSVAVDVWRFIDSYARRRAHMPFGFFPLIINSTTLLKRWYERFPTREQIVTWLNL